MKLCSECGFSNQPDALECARCGFRFAAPPRVQGNESRSGIPVLLLASVLALLCAAAVSAKVAFDRNQLDAVRARLAHELRLLDDSHAKQLQLNEDEADQRLRAEDAAHKTRLDDKSIVSGELARNNRAREWQRRVAHDPEFAHSARERAILKMQKLGSDPSLAAREALEEVARLATPPGSRIEVTNAYNQFAVRVAFKISAVAPGEAGVTSKHLTTDSMRREAREMSALVMRELFDYCGARGIARLSVSCNHAIYRHGYIPSAATDLERKELEKRGAVVMACLYRVTIDAAQARAVPNWRALSIPRVMELMRVDYDAMTHIKLNDLPRDFPLREDPDMQLEF